MMITSGAVTNRIDRLEKRGFLRREADPTDGRVVLVTLTNAGFEKIEAALPDHTANLAHLIASLTPADKATLADLLRQTHHALDDASSA